MFKRKTLLRMIFGAIIVLTAIGVVILVKLSHQSAIDLVNSPAMNLLPKTSGLYQSVLFRIMAKETSRLPQVNSTEKMNEDGMVSILHGIISEETRGYFDTFVADSSDGKPAQIIITIFTTEGDPIFINVLFDQVQYLAVVDKTHDRFNSAGEEDDKYCFDHMKIITNPETDTKFVVLTNDSQLTFEQLRNAQIGSNMESIDSFQLFSFYEK